MTLTKPAPPMPSEEANAHKPMPNQITMQDHAVHLLRRLLADPTRQDAQNAAQAIVEKVQGVALALTAQAVLQTAIASYPDETITDALARLDAEVDHTREQDRQLQAIFDAAHLVIDQAPHVPATELALVAGAKLIH
jgi:hypothetical protein